MGQLYGPSKNTSRLNMNYFMYTTHQYQSIIVTFSAILLFDRLLRLIGSFKPGKVVVRTWESSDRFLTHDFIAHSTLSSSQNTWFSVFGRSKYLLYISLQINFKRVHPFKRTSKNNDFLYSEN